MLTPLLPIPHRTQRHSSDCLVACAAMVLDFLSQPVAYEKLREILGIIPGLGAPASNVQNLSRVGISVTYATGDLNNLQEHLNQGLPCIAFVHTIQLSYWEENVRHAVVVAGMDDSFVYLHDPFFPEAPQRVSHLEFQLAWDEMDNMFAVLSL